MRTCRVAPTERHVRRRWHDQRRLRHPAVRQLQLQRAGEQRHLHAVALLHRPPFTGGGKRKFDVLAEGQRILNDYDIAAEAGRESTRCSRRSVTVADGTFSMNFVSVKDNAILSAFSLVPQG